jgi:regulator of protease activity HflC (stomatin/prohibitin superfamily)
MPRVRVITWIAALFFVAMLLPSCVRTVDSGRSAVLWTLFGGTQEGVFGEGVHLIAPWNRFTRYDVRTQDQKEVLHILSANGLSVSLEASIRFRPLREELPRLHAEIGPDYFDVIVAPVVRSEARKVGGRYSPEEIYASKREVVEHEILEEVRRAVAGKHVELVATGISDELLRWKGIEATEKIAQSSNSKVVVIGSGKDGLPLILGDH